MPSNLNLDYYYGTEAEQYSFYRVPKTLLTDPRFKSVSIEAKVLYGLLLDRMGLSVKNGWMDKDRRVYIYFTQEDAMALMSCGKDKATRLFRELDQNGIGLIERKKQGQGRPARIYVKNFTLPTEPGQTTPCTVTAPTQETHGAPQTAESQPSRPLDSTVPKTAHFEQSAPLEMSGQDNGFCAPNKTDMNKTDLNDTESSISPPDLAVASSASLASPQAAKLTHYAAPALPTANAPLVCGGDPSRLKSRMRMDEMDGYREQIKENIGYGLLLQERPYDAEEIDGYVELMAETCASHRECIRVNGEELPIELVKKRLLRLDSEHIRYVMESLRNCTTRVVNIRAYTLAALYNAPTTIKQHYSAQVSYDMAQGFRGN